MIRYENNALEMNGDLATLGEELLFVVIGAIAIYADNSSDNEARELLELIYRYSSEAIYRGAELIRDDRKEQSIVDRLVKNALVEMSRRGK